MEFYDAIASGYDEMTGFRQRLERAGVFVVRLLERKRACSALDVACGSGVFALALARAGLRVTGADVSTGMLTAAERNADDLGLHVDWVHAPMQEIGRTLAQRFDLILCTGNSLPHLLTDEDLNETLAGFHQKLTDDGVLVLQLLNYERIYARQERIVEISRRANTEYIRFYDALESDRIVFNLLEVRWEHDAPVHALHSTELRGYRYAQLVEALRRHGFTGIEAFAGLGFASFDPEESETLMLMARRAPR